MKKYILIITFTIGLAWGLPLNKTKGNIAECVYESIYPAVGKIAGEYNLANGIDHINILRDKAGGKIIKCTITDSKFGNAKLATDRLDMVTGVKNVQQMSDKWILQNLEKLNTMDLSKSKLDPQTKNKILKARNNGEYKRLMGLVKSGVCEKRLFNLKFHDDGRINTGYHEVISDGNNRVRTKPITKDTYANRLINPAQKGTMDVRDKKLLDKAYECTAKTICPKGDMNCISDKKAKFYKNPKSVKPIMERASSSSSGKKIPLKNSQTKISFRNKQKNIPKNTISRSARVSSVKIVKSIGTKTVLKAGAKGTAKGAFASIASKLPYVGIAAQVAWDAYIGYKLEVHDEKLKVNTQNIQSNSQEIALNAQYINKLLREQEILGINIDENTQQIQKLFGKLFTSEGRIETIDSQIIQIMTQTAGMSQQISENRQEIQKVKDGIFFTGIEQMQDYYETNTSSYLTDAIGDFRITLKTNNQKVSHLAYYYLIISKYELYLLKNDKSELEDINRYFDDLRDYVVQNPQSLTLLNSTYFALSDLGENDLDTLRKKLGETTRKVIQKIISKKRFDDAYDRVESYLSLLKKDPKSDPLYQQVIDMREENLKAHENFTSIRDAMDTIEQNQNQLLNEKAVRYLYKEDSFRNALKILQTKRFADEEFRTKASIRVFEQLGEEERLKAFAKKVENNPNYSENIREVLKKYR